MRHQRFSLALSGRLVIMTFVVVSAAILFVAAFSPTTAVAQSTSTSMRMPFSDHETWKVVNGYGSGTCHKRVSPPGCGGDEYYAFDIVPVSGDAGGKSVVSPVTGTVYGQPFYIGSGRGYGVKIRTSDGYIVHLYHLMNIPSNVASGRTVTQGQVVGKVYNAYSGSINHLHIQLSTASGVSLPLKLSGKSYYSGPSWSYPNQQRLQNNVLYYNGWYNNYSGNSAPFSNYVASDPWLGNDAVGNDRTSSLRINPGCTMWLYEHINYGGRWSTGFTSDVLNLQNNGFNDMASSMKLSC